ncbi:MAG TPA: hypothetical protein VJH23_03000 [archaeon]|nr:hypothetical protein [archaeon]
MDLNYDEIRRIHRLEKNSSKLVEVSQEFYSDLNAFIATEKKEYLDSFKDLSSTKARDFTNLKNMVEEIFALREKKILNKVLVASRTGDKGEEHMALQEKRLFNELLVLLEKHSRILAGVFSDESRGESEKDLNTLSVEVLSDIPVFVGGDMNEYGPFPKGSVVSLPLKIAKLLSTKKLVEVKE